MAIVRLSKSGKQAQFVDEEGNVFVTSTNYLMGLLQGTMQKNMVILSRLPLKMGEGRFPKSELWDPNGLAKKHEKFAGDVKNNHDVLSKKFEKEKEEDKLQEDISPW